MSSDSPDCCVSCKMFVAVLAILVLSYAVKCWRFVAGPIVKIDVKMTPEETCLSLQSPAVQNMEINNPKRPGYVQCFDKSTMQPIGEVIAMDAAAVYDVCQRSKIAQAKWIKTSYPERRRVLKVILRYIVDHQDEICLVCCRDSGKPRLDALLGEIITTCEKIRCVISNGEAWLSREYRPTGPLMMHKRAYVEYYALGVIGVIAPWNYPFHNLLNHIISGIFAGNGVVVKVSEFTSWSSRYFVSIVSEALTACGHNPDLVSVITGFSATGQALVSCPDVDKIVFTGSPQVGKLVMASAAAFLKPVVLELGGKDPMVVCEDVDIASILPVAMRGVFQNSGQNCCGIERIFVQSAKYDEFVAAAEKAVGALRQGRALDEDIDVGAMVMPRQLEIIDELVNDARNKGARVLVGGSINRDLSPGLFYLPTLICDLTSDMRIAQEEIFGPVMCVFKVDGGDEDCIRMVNCCNFGLGSSVFCGNSHRAVKIGASIRAGMTTINDFGVNYLVQSLPFGGIKHSGFDRFAGPEGLRGLCLQKSVVVDRFPEFLTGSIRAGKGMHLIPPVLQYPANRSSVSFASSMIALMYSVTGIFGKINALTKMMSAQAAGALKLKRKN